MNSLRLAFRLQLNREPQRHDPAIDDLLDHSRMGDEDIVGIQVERSHASFAMAFDTVPLHDPRNANVRSHIR